MPNMIDIFNLSKASFGNNSDKDKYRIDSKYLYIQALVNSVDPDQTPHNAASDKGLHCLPVTQHFRYINR